MEVFIVICIVFIMKGKSEEGSRRVNNSSFFVSRWTVSLFLIYIQRMRRDLAHVLCVYQVAGILSQILDTFL